MERDSIDRKGQIYNQIFFSFFKGMCSIADLQHVRLQWDMEVKMLIAVKSRSQFPKVIGTKDKHSSITNMELLVKAMGRD